MQNCMVGVHGYQTNASGTDCSCGGITTTQTSGATFSDDMEYPEVNVYGDSAGGSYVLNAINVEKPEFLVEWTPLMNTAATETLMSGLDVVSCLTTDLSGSSQVIPFYKWYKEWGVPDGFGGEGNDWSQDKYHIRILPLVGHITLVGLTILVWVTYKTIWDKLNLVLEESH